MRDLTKLTFWMHDNDVPDTFMRKALSEMKKKRAVNLFVRVNLISDKANFIKNKLNTLCSADYYANKFDINCIFCFMLLDERWRNKYVIPKNALAVCELIKEHRKKNSAKDSLYLGQYNCFNERDNYLIGIDFDEYDDVINLQNTTHTSDNQEENRVISSKELLSTYDFVVTSGDLLTYDFRKELKELYFACKEASIPLLEPLEGFYRGEFVGAEESIMCKTYVLGTQEYIYHRSYDMIRKKLDYNNFADEIKNIL